MLYFLLVLDSTYLIIHPATKPRKLCIHNRLGIKKEDYYKVVHFRVANSVAQRSMFGRPRLSTRLAIRVFFLNWYSIWGILIVLVRQCIVYWVL